MAMFDNDAFENEAESTQEVLDTENLAESMSSDDLAKLAGIVIEEYEVDFRSVEPYYQEMSKWTELAVQVQEVKNFPWQNASNVKAPLLTIACLQFGARAYPALMPGDKIAKGKVIGKDPNGEKKKRSDRLQEHMSFQIYHKMKTYEEDMDRMLTAILPGYGTAFKKTYQNFEEGTPYSDLLEFDELVVNYNAKSVEEAVRKTHILRYTENQVEELIRMGVFLDFDYTNQAGESALQLPTISKDIREKSLKQEEPEIEDDAYEDHIFLEQHRWYDIDNTGIKKPVIVTVHYNTQEVVSVYARFNEDDIVLDGETGDIIKIKPKEYFTSYGFIPNPASKIYHLGFFTLLGPILESVNTLINQLIDSGTQNNLQSGFLGKGVQIKGGQIKMRPGTWRTLDYYGQDLKSQIFPLPTKEPSNVLFLLLGFLNEQARDIASVKDILLGENPGQNQKATTTLAVIEQGLKTFSSIYKRIYRSQTKELEKLQKLLHMYGDQEEYNLVVSDGSQEFDIKEDYAFDMKVVPVADPNISSDAQIAARAQALLEKMGTGLINPQVAMKRILEAEKQENVEELMNVPPPGPSIEELKLQQEGELGRAKLQIEVLKIQLEALKAKADAQIKGDEQLMKAIQMNIDALGSEADRELAKEQAKNKSQST